LPGFVENVNVPVPPVIDSIVKVFVPGRANPTPVTTPGDVFVIVKQSSVSDRVVMFSVAVAVELLFPTI
jgi:hypothetical protein